MQPGGYSSRSLLLPRESLSHSRMESCSSMGTPSRMGNCTEVPICSRTAAAGQLRGFHQSIAAACESNVDCNGALDTGSCV